MREVQHGACKLERRHLIQWHFTQCNDEDLSIRVMCIKRRKSTLHSAVTALECVLHNYERSLSQQCLGTGSHHTSPRLRIRDSGPEDSDNKHVSNAFFVIKLARGQARHFLSTPSSPNHGYVSKHSDKLTSSNTGPFNYVKGLVLLYRFQPCRLQRMPCMWKSSSGPSAPRVCT